ncbi:MAG: hypothetical protein CM15mP103_12130 [Gammaproteobacteria bacterium]|nr:MAG: hypothetical protein CM15mP103_12130 [Gammaproteobacteria bacterium]
MVESSTPPAMAIAKGGQNSLPSKMSGRKPPNVVTVVETIWRLSVHHHIDNGIGVSGGSAHSA